MDPCQSSVADQAAAYGDDIEMSKCSGNSNDQAMESEQMEANKNEENEHPARLYLHLYKATLKGDWMTIKAYCDRDPSLLSAGILGFGDTILHVAVSTGHSADLVKLLVEYMSAAHIEEGNRNGDTPLHYAAIAGNTDAAKLLVRRNLRTPLLRNRISYTPFHHAAQFGHRQTFCFLLSTIPDQDLSRFVNEDGVRILNLLMAADFYG